MAKQSTRKKAKAPAKEWEFIVGMFGGGNYVLHGDDFHISFNPNPNPMFCLFGSDDGGSETALCKDGDYFILNGDFRDEYEAAFDGVYAACLKVFKAHKDDAKSSWSNDA